jgi:hypothetical protein
MSSLATGPVRGTGIEARANAAGRRRAGGTHRDGAAEAAR